jgi:hypothetical protein
MLCWYLTGVESILSFRFKEFSIRNCRGRCVVALHAKANFCATVPLKEFGSQLRSKQWQGYESCDWEAPAVVMPLGTGVATDHRGLATPMTLPSKSEQRCSDASAVTLAGVAGHYTLVDDDSEGVSFVLF